MKIKNIFARLILDSRGNPTIETDIALSNNNIGRASVPSGASVGSREALELRDNDNRFQGKGVNCALKNINEIIYKELENKSFSSQKDFDNYLIKLDGTHNKANLGANAILSCSLSFAKACAISQGIPLYKYLGDKKIMPRPLMNIINGGSHADNKLDFQEFMIVPLDFPDFSETLRCGVEIFHSLKKILSRKNLSINVGDEGGFAPELNSTVAALDMILLSIEEAGYIVGEQVGIALDVAASEFFNDNKYVLKGEDKVLETDEFIEYYEKLVSKYPIISIEDPLSEFDWEGWQKMTEKLGSRIQIVGDDIFVTNPEIISRGIKENIANAVLIKPNQIGTLTETLEAMQLASSHNYKTIVSHRSGETEDTFIAHLAVGSGCGQIKTGSLCRTDRVGKYNELLRIEEEILKNHLI